MKLSRLFMLVLILIFLAACSNGTQPQPVGAFSAALREEARDGGLELEELPRYYLDLAVFPDERLLTGKATIKYANTALAELREVYLRLYPNIKMYGGQLDVARVLVDGSEVPFVITGKGVDLKVPLPRTLAPRRSATIEITFSLLYPEMQGEYDFFGVREGVIVLPDFYPMVVPLIDGEWRLDTSPNYGEAAFTAISLYEMDVEVPEGYEVFVPGVSDRLAVDAGRKSYHVVVGLGRNVGLVLAQGYERQEQAEGDVSFVGLALPAQRTAARAALSHAMGAFSFYEEFLATYPLQNLLLVAVPLESATVHLSGMILVNHSYLNGDREELERFLAGEVARQWWGFRLAADPLRHPWVDPALAEFSSYLYLRRVHGPGGVATIPERWLSESGQGERRGLSDALESYGSLVRYNVITGARGPLFWQAVENLVGEDGVSVIMAELQQEYAYGFIDTATIAAVVEELVGPPGAAILAEWGLIRVE